MRSDSRLQLRRTRNRRRRSRPGRARRLAALAWLLVLVGAALIGRVGWMAWGRGLWHGATPEVSASPPPLGIDTLRLDDPPRSRDRFEGASLCSAGIDPSASARLVEFFDPAAPGEPVASGPLRVEYSLDEDLTERVFEILRRGRVLRGHAIVSDPRNGRLLAYVSTDPEGLPPERSYPAASIVKVLTAAAMLEASGPDANPRCVYRGNPYRLSRRRLERPRSGRETTLERALAKSNNQCFAQWALHDLGEQTLRDTLDRFGWLASPAPGHATGQMELAETRLDLGRLGSGLDGVRVTPLHVAQLASILTHGDWLEPWWIDRVVDARGRSLALPPRTPARRVLSDEVAQRLRSMLVSTTTRGTARGAFRDRRGRPLLGAIKVAGKTGNLSGRDPHGRYEWFLGLAPAEEPSIAVTVLQLQGHLWWARSSELAAEILRSVFCERRACRPELAHRWTGDLGAWASPLLVSDLARSNALADER